MRILQSVNNTPTLKRFLIPKNSHEDCKDWVDIIINYEEKTFIAKKIIATNLGDEWIAYTDATFPSSLLNEFLRY